MLDLDVANLSVQAGALITVDTSPDVSFWWGDARHIRVRHTPCSTDVIVVEMSDQSFVSAERIPLAELYARAGHDYDPSFQFTNERAFEAAMARRQAAADLPELVDIDLPPED